MRFALNYSPAAARLFTAGMIRVDLFKSADFPEMIADSQRLGPVYVHFALECGPRAQYDLAAVARTRDATATPYVNTHLVTRRPHFPTLNGHTPNDADLSLATDQLLAHLRPLVARFGPANVIAENLIYHGPIHDDWLRPGITPAVITRTIESADCGLLLDLSHARIAAHYLNVDAKDYISSLPVHRLKELHVTGLKMHEGLLADHFAMTDDDWQFFAWALSEIRQGNWSTPDIVAFEYGGTGAPFAWRSDPAVIASQVPRLYDMVHGL